MKKVKRKLNREYILKYNATYNDKDQLIYCKSITEYDNSERFYTYKKYNERDVVIITDQDPNSEIKIIETIDVFGNIIKAVASSMLHFDISETHLYEYNDYNKITRDITKFGENIISDRKYFYEDKYLIRIEELFKGTDECIRTYTYNEDYSSAVLKYTRFDEQYSITCVVDEKGNIVKEVDFNNKTYNETTYNDNGRVISEIGYRLTL